ncbi:MAG: DUF177 domain-containing protein, partial [Pseudoflavonifractor sp.]
MTWNGAVPAVCPVQVFGEVRNRAGALELEGDVVAELNWACDRCLKPFTETKTIPLDTLLAKELANEESDEIVLLDGDELDLDDLARTAFILDVDTKHLCSENCKGLCVKCGADLNVGPCKCEPEPDPRLAALAQLLED